MTNNLFRRSTSRAHDWAVAAAVGAFALIINFATLAHYVFPGNSAWLMSLWNGFDFVELAPYPIMAAFTRLLGGGNAVAAVCGAVVAMALCHLVTFLIRWRLSEEEDAAFRDRLARIGGAVAALVFTFIPCVREASTHVEPKLFALMMALLSFCWLIPWSVAAKGRSWPFALALGISVGVGLVDNVLVFALMPVFLLAIVGVSMRRGEKFSSPLAVFIVAFPVAFLIAQALIVGNLSELVHLEYRELVAYCGVRNWSVAFLFTMVPMIVMIVTSRRTFGVEGTWAQWLFYLAIAIIALLSLVAPQFSPSALMIPHGILPVTLSACSAVTAAMLAVYWLLQFRQSAQVDDAAAEGERPSRAGKLIGAVTIGVFALVVTVSFAIHCCVSDRNRGAFADRVAERIVADLGERRWLVTDGSLDDHLRFAAARAGKEVVLVPGNRDHDEKFLERLAAKVEASGIGGEHNAELAMAVRELGVVSFITDWFFFDRAEASRLVAVCGHPDLLHSVGVKPVPELLFFGCDGDRSVDWEAWDEFEPLLAVPGPNWGSFQFLSGRLAKEDAVARMRYDLRRHFGLLANNRGVWLQDAGRDDEAWDLYELVLRRIDADNVAAALNEYGLVCAGNHRALEHKAEIERRLKDIVADAERRISVDTLSRCYGYVRNPQSFASMGIAWARSGQAETGLSHLRRAMDFVPADQRGPVLDMMAQMYSGKYDKAKSRETYLEALALNPDDSDALTGLAGLAIRDGKVDEAIGYLERNIAAAGEDPSAKLDRALICMLKGDYAAAGALLRSVTDADRQNARAWTMLIALSFREFDESTDADRRKQLLKLVEGELLPMIEHVAGSANDFNVQSTRAMLLLRKPTAEGESANANLKSARDIFASAYQTQPARSDVGDLVLRLDMALNDPEDAERQAKAILRRNRNAPFANYILGSVALNEGKVEDAEAFLRRAVNAETPDPMAMNDLAEALRRQKKWSEAIVFARRATEAAPRAYVLWETLGTVILESGGDLDEAEKCVNRAVELSNQQLGRDGDVRMLISLARVQLAHKDAKESIKARMTIRKILPRVGELTDFERGELEELRKRAR